MKTIWILFAAAIPALAQQSFDFKLLDKLGANATGSTNITLEGDVLKLATSMFGGKSSLGNLTGVYVRSFEFAKTGQYNEADLAPFRNYVKTLQWTKIVHVIEDDGTSEIYVKPLPNDLLGGVALISSEHKEVTVVFISGVLNLSDYRKLSINLGLPFVIPDLKKFDDSKKDR